MLKNKAFTNEPIKVSVAIIAYNVGKYLEKTIESVLEQECDFRVEIVIGEDCSTDDTLKVALNYQNRFPSIVRVLSHKKNLGLTPNSVATQDACKGEYIALLDGDDYWTNNHKLSRQITFLDENLEFSGSAHQADIIFDDINGENKLFGSNENSTLYINDMLTHRKFHTSSLVYRKAIWDETGGIPTTISSNERAIYPMVISRGPIQYLANSMCIYRRSSIGISARVNLYELETDLKMIPWLKQIAPNFPANRYRSFLHFTTYSYGYNQPFWGTIKHFFLFILFSFSYFPKNLGDVKHGVKEVFRVLK